MLTAFFILGISFSASAATNVSGNITTDTVWTLAGSPYIITNTVTVQGTDGEDGVTTLTIEPGVQLKFESSGKLQIGGNSGDPGALVAKGTADNKIRFTANSESPTPGSWQNIQFLNTTHDAVTIMEHCDVSYAGYSNNGSIYIYQSNPLIRDTTVSYSKQNGIWVYQGAPVIENSTFDNNTEYDLYFHGDAAGQITDNTFNSGLYVNSGTLDVIGSNTFNCNNDYPVRVTASDVHALVSGATMNNLTPESTIEVAGGTISKDAVWTDIIPYIILNTITVQGTDGDDGVTTLTIEPGAQLKFGSSIRLKIGADSGGPGALAAKGTADNKIRFTASSEHPTPGSWQSIQFLNTTHDATTIMEHCDVSYAGYGNNGSIYIYQSNPVIRNTTVRYSKQKGIWVQQGAPVIENSTFTNNTEYDLYFHGDAAGQITDNTFNSGLYVNSGTFDVIGANTFNCNTDYPVRVTAPDVHALVSGATMNNRTPESTIEVAGGTISKDAVWTDIIPYTVLGTITVQGTDGSDGVTTLTIESGAQLKFGTSGRLNIGENSGDPGALVAKGTADNKIRFTASLEPPTPGSWYGIQFLDTTDDTTTIMEHCDVSYAGYSNSGSIYIYRSNPVIRNTTVRYSKQKGIWVQQGTPVIKNNTFENNTEYDLYFHGDAAGQITGNTFNNGLYANTGTLDTIGANTFNCNTDYPVRITASDVHALISGATMNNLAPESTIEVTGGTISKDAVWTDIIPYTILGTITVQGTDGDDGVTTLTIAPGAQLKFGSSGQLNIGANSEDPGALLARGTAGEKISFTSNSDTPTPGSWYGIKFLNTTHDATTIMEQCDVSYAGYGNSGSINIYQSKPVIKNTTVRYSKQHGIWASQGAPVIESSTFADNTEYDLYFQGNAAGQITGNTFNNGFYANTGTFDAIGTNTFNYNNDYPVRVTAPDVHPLISGSTMNNLTPESTIEVAGETISKDALWTDIMPYTVLGNITVQGTDGDDGVTTLTIEPGAQLKFGSYGKLNIGANVGDPGALAAKGTAGEKISFTSSSDTPIPGSWHGIQFLDTTDATTTIMEYCNVSYAGWSQGSIYIQRSNPTIKNTTIRYSKDSGVFIYSGSPRIEGCTISNNGQKGIHVGHSDALEIIDNIFSENTDYDLYYGNAAAGSVTGNTFSHGFYAQSGSPELLEANTFNYTNDYPVRVSGPKVLKLITESVFNNISPESTIIVTAGTVTEDAVWPNTFIYNVTGIITVQGTDGDDGVTTLTIQPGAQFKFESSGRLNIGANSGDPGALAARGTAGEKISFTSNSDTPTPGSWHGIQFLDTTDDATTIMEYCDISYGGWSQGSIYIYESNPTIKNTNIQYSKDGGIFIYSGSPKIEGCTISNNGQKGIYVHSSGTPEIINNTFSENTDYDLYYRSAAGSVTGNTFSHGFYAQSGMFDTLGANTFNYTNDYPVRVPAPNIHKFIAESTFNNLSTESTIIVTAGTVTEDAVWPDTFIYDIIGAVTVQGTDGDDGVTTLTIEPGAQLKFGSSGRLNIGANSGDPGALAAKGTAVEKIAFTSNSDTPVPGNWYGIQFLNTTDDATTVMEYCDISYGGWSQGSIYIYESNPTIKNTNIQYSKDGGIFIYSGSPAIEGCTISNNGQKGIYLYSSGTPEIIDNAFSENTDYDLYYRASAAGSVTGNTFSHGFYAGGGKFDALEANTFDYTNDYPVRVPAPNTHKFISESVFNNLSTESTVIVTAGSITEDAVWPKTFIYDVIGAVTIQGTDGDDGVTTLTIEPGTQLKFGSSGRLDIGGNSGDPGALKAKATAGEKISFTSNSDTPAPGSWYGINFLDTTDDATTIMESCDVFYASWNQGSIYIYESNPTIKNTIIRYSKNSGIYIYSGSPKIESCNISNSRQKGIYVNSSGAPEIINNTFSENTDYDLYYNGSTTGSVTGNTFNHGLYTASGRLDTLAGNTFNHNNNFQLKLHPDNIADISNNTFTSLNSDSTILVNYGTITRDSVWPADMAYHITGSVTVAGTDGLDNLTTLILEPGAKLLFDRNYRLNIGASSGEPGAIVAQGTPDNRIVFDSALETPAPGDWAGIYINDTADDATTLVEYCAILHTGSGIGGLNLTHASPLVQYNIFENNREAGIYVSGSGADNAMINCNTIQNNRYGIQVVSNGSPRISNNNFNGNTEFALYTTHSASVDATENWWNDENGPGYNGEEISGNINFTPWLTAQTACVNDNPTNKPPFSPYHPTPPDQAVNVEMTDRTVTAGWMGRDPNFSDTLVYDVYLGVESTGLEQVSTSQSASQYLFSELLPGKPYFWQIIARDGHGAETPGPVWQFTTAGNPPDLVVSDLSWTPDTDLQAAQDITIAVEIQNQGTGPSVEPFQATLDIDGQPAKTWDINQMIPSGERIMRTHVWTAQTGDHDLEAVADAGQAILESQEDNNRLAKQITGIKDPEPPALVSITPGDGEFLQQVDAVTFTLADTHGQVDDTAVIAAVQVSNQDGQTIGGAAAEDNDTFTFTPSAVPLADGTYMVSLTAADQWGNTAPHTITFTVDTAAPAEPSITGSTVDTGLLRIRPFANQSSTALVTVTGTREDNTRVVAGIETDAVIDTIGTVRHVGASGAYATIQEAIDAADDGDMILIDPGIYLENILFNKWVHLKGNSPDPEQVMIKSPGNAYSGYPPTLVFELTYDSPLSTPVYIEGIRFDPYTSSWNRTMRLPNAETTGKAGTIVFNRCRFISSANTYPASNLGENGPVQTEVRFLNCYFQRGYAHFLYMNSPNWGLEKCELNNAYKSYRCATLPTPKDHVITPTPGYGTGYGAWYLGGTTATTDIGSGDWSLGLYLAQGQNQISVRLEDQAGNTSTPVWVDVLVDSVAPQIGETRPADQEFLDQPPAGIELDYLEDTTAIDLDNSLLYVKDMALQPVPGTWADSGTVSGKGTLTFSPAADLEQGTFQVEVRLQDTFGNQDTAQLFHFTIDTTAPEAPGIDPVTSPTVTSTQTITGTKEAYAALYLDGESIGSHTEETTWSHTVTLAPGLNTFTFTLRDRAGNSSEPGIATIRFDDTPPPAVSGLTLAPEGDGTTVSLDWQGYDESLHGDIAAYRIYAETSAFTSVSGLTARKTVGAGTFETSVDNLARRTVHWFAVVAVDHTGNALETVTPASAEPVDVVAPENPTGLGIQSFTDRLVLNFTSSTDSHGDLAGYRVYLDGSSQHTPLAPDAVVFEKTGLSLATACDFKLTAVDTDGNESQGAAIRGITLMENPTGVSATPYSGYAHLSWQNSTPGEYVKHYRVYTAQAPFSSVQGMAPKLTVTGSSANVAGLDNNTPYYFAVTAVNLSDGEQKQVATVSATPTQDTQGPSLSAIRFDDGPLTDGMSLSASGFVGVDMDDPAGVSHVEFYFNGTLVRKDFSPPFSAYIDIHDLGDGSYALAVKGVDTLGNTSSHTYTLTVGLAAPSVPVITAPAHNDLTNKKQVTISGTTDKYTDVTLVLDNTPVGDPVSIGALGLFNISLTLKEGENRIRARASNRSGTSPDSPEILVTLDTSIPDSPRSLSGQSRPDGEIKLLWQRPLNKIVSGYDVYRSDADFTTTQQAVRVNTEPVATPGFTDLPPHEGNWIYRVTATDASGNESALSDPVSVASDSTGPVALAIQYTSRGMTDPATGRHAPATVDITLELSEPLGSTPFLTLTPDGGIPQSVTLEKTSDLSYSGVFTITDAMPTGMTYAVFSARDIAGNRGTEIASGGQILLDTRGPAVSRLEITPASPVKNNPDTPETIRLAFGLTEAVKPGTTPDVRLDIANGSQVLPAGTYTPATPQAGEAQAWETEITLPGDTGLLGPESVVIRFSGSDDLDNIGTDIPVTHDFQVYQGGLPPLAPPGALAGKALADGRVNLSWDPVENAGGYQVFRQAPGETELTLLDTLDPQASYTDQTVVDGTHTYALTTIRRENQEESISGLSSTVAVVSDATAPNPPENLRLDMVSQGIRAQWDAPAQSESVTYAIYRSDQPRILSVDGMTPLATGIDQTLVVDPTPSPTEHCYAVTAVDNTGNESPPSNDDYLNFDLLPVSQIQVSQKDTAPPVVQWSHADTSGKIAGYWLYLGKDKTGLKVNEALMGATSFTDYGYTGQDRSYTVIAVDTNAVESMGRYITLPRVSFDLASAPALKRGIMNELEYQVENLSGQALANAELLAQIGGHIHRSQPFSLAAGETKPISIIVGGYDTLKDLEPLTTTLEITPNPGESASLIRTVQAEVSDSLMPLQVLTEEFIRGGTGKVWFTLNNTGAADVEIATAENSNKQPSADIRYHLEDEDGNVLFSQSFEQILGDNIVTLSNRRTVARIPSGSMFTSTPMDLFVPANAPNTLYVRLEINHIHHQLGQPGQVTMAGTRTRQQVSLRDTSYYGEVLSALPAVSKGDQDIIITGRAVDRATDTPLAQALLDLVITREGFERNIRVTTDDTGAFTRAFTPLDNEAGIFRVNAVHPDLLDRPEQGMFIINRVQVSPSKIQLGIPRNYAQKISIKVATEKGTDLTGLSLAPKSVLPQGIHLDTGTPLPLVSGGSTVTLNLSLWADNTADDTASFELIVTSDESPDNPWAVILVDALFSESKPALYFTPDHIETGVAQGNMVTETITLSNKGLADMAGVSLSLVNASGDPAPDWVRLNTPAAINTLAVGDERNVSVSFLPGDGQPQGMQIFYLRVDSENYPRTDIGLYPTITSSGIGNVLFKLSDIYTGTFNARNELIRGLANASITLQNEQTLDTRSAASDSLGEALLQDLPSGPYKCKITVDNHQEYTGRVWIRPGITTAKEVFLEYNLVTVEWEVNEITIEDKYEILLSATFETDVPAAVVVAEPLSMTLPDMEKGDVFLGEFVLTNHGLVRADDIAIPVPESDEYFQYEILTGLPDSLDAKQRITIPYRITCLKSLDRDEDEDTGGGCYSYQKCIPVSYGYACANGETSSGSTRHCFHKSGGSCGSGSGGGSTTPGSNPGASYHYSGGSGGSSSPGPGSTPLITTTRKCLPKPSPIEVFRARVKQGYDKAKQLIKDGITQVGCSVNTSLREYNDDAVDLVVKVPNGSILVARDYRAGQWQWDHAAMVMDGSPDDTKPYSPSEYGPDQMTRDGVVYEKTSAGIYTQGTHVIERKPDIPPYAYNPEKYRYKDKHGNFHQYDSLGRLIAFGNRFGTTAELSYDSTAAARPSGMADRNGTPVLWFEYNSDGRLTLARTSDDSGSREVSYEYTGPNLTRAVDPAGDETRYVYDGNNNLTQTIDAAGRSTIVTYDANNDPVSVTDAHGNGHVFEYDYDKNKREYYALIKTSSGRIKEIWTNDKGETKRVDINGRTVKKINQDGRDLITLDDKGNQTRTEYDENQNLTRIIYPDNTQVTFTYDLRFNKVRQIIDPLGRTTLFEYDDKGSLVKKIQAKDTPDQRTSVFTHDALGRILTAATLADADTEATLTTFTYDTIGNLETITDPMGHTTRFLAYDTMGNPLQFKDPRDNEWTFVYDAKGRITSQTTPQSHTTAFEYDGANNRTAVINARLKRFEFEYDDHNNQIKAIDPLAHYTTTAYNTDHLPVLTTDPEGRQASATYDNEGRVITTTDPAGNTTSYAYSDDAASFVPSHLPVTITYPSFTRHLTYDRMQRIIKETDVLNPDTSLTRTRTYDAAGNLSTSTDTAGRTVTYAYDNLNRLTIVTDPDNGQTLRTWDNRDNLIMLQDPEDGIQYFTYDKNNRLLTSARPMGGITRYEYDGAGNRTAITDPKGQRIEYTYDPDNRLTRVRYYQAGNLADPVKTVGFTHDASGNLLTWSDGQASGTFTYDDLDRKSTETVNYGTFALSHAYTYTPAGNTDTFTGPDNTPVSYAYDPGGRLAGITLPGTGQAGYAYTPESWNSPASLTLPGGAKQTYTYDSLMRPATITAKDPGQNNLLTRAYTYDTPGNITAKATEHGDYTYQYDTLDRLTTALNPTLADEAYTYDRLGNRTTDVKMSGPIVHNADNQVETYGSTGYDYDANGNMIRKTENGSDTLFFYNLEDRLHRVEDGSGGTIATYGYDPFGRRLWKEVGGTRTYFHYANEGLVGEYDADGNEIKAYGYTPGSTWTTDPLFMKAGGSYYWYQNDHNGTPQKLIAANGLVIWDGIYDAFGNCRIETEGIANNLRFAGQYFDAETGLHYNLNRYYDPAIGRYLRVDPFGDGLNLYAYAFNNPSGLIDPLGLCAVNTLGRYLGTGFGEEAAMWYAQNYNETGAWYYMAGGLLASLWTPETYVQTAGTLLTAGMLGAELKAAQTTGEMAEAAFTYAVEEATGLPGLCFVAGTLIQTQDGSKPIEDIEINDIVLSKNEKTSELEWKPVVDTFVRYNQQIIQITIEDETGNQETIGTTEEHPFWIKAKGWTPARKILPGDEIFTSKGGWLKVTGSTWLPERQTVYNFEVKELHNYFVGTSGAWVHNMCKMEVPKVASKKANPLDGTTFTDKVKRQMEGKDLDHNFPSLIDKQAGAAKVKKITGGDGIERTKVELPGSINGKEGNYSWIIEPDKTINHRQFERFRKK
ncbi:MAG: right-handed parallel beta-helix repeat-containing protein [Desulfobacter sp.]